ncbi:ferritin-like domain-containing protein [Usitatibacter palustris]|uniref:Rubrerythrin n=1 Tax=Usitatibacter palustris TaxID=2732487 RepID=A0A6M4H779_9PROT|nr:ferritin-like domain-containing protein [Usitatibacter palustris]QJR14234.1 hypothetical protein DSM104440_01027 [Usitatibacter palustris]
MTRTIATIEEFYAHALAIEREAAERYTEFEAYFANRGEEILAALCRNLATMEARHLAALIEVSRELTLPVIARDGYCWLGPGSPEAAARELFYRATSERHLLEIALNAELNAQRFFEWAAATSPSAEVREQATEMAAEEAQHVGWVSSALEYLPRRAIDWQSIFSVHP